MSIPKKISPSPILEAVVEIRFENELPSEVIFGKLYGALSTEFDQTEQLPNYKCQFSSERCSLNSNTLLITDLRMISL